MTIEPETKNWTWVLEQPCEECGFDCRAFPREEVGRRCREAAEPWAGFLADPRARLRPTEDRWSALEYACHVRDVYRRGSYRLGRMLHEDNPLFENWDQDQTAVNDRYDAQDPTMVAAELGASATDLSDLYDTVSGEQWQRPGTRSDGALFDIESFGRYFLHDLVHHIADVQHGFAALGPAAKR